MIDRTVGLHVVCWAMAWVVGMREAEVDIERALAIAFLEELKDLVGMPGASLVVGPFAFGGIFPNFKLLIGGFVAISNLASAHGLVAGALEDGGKR